MSTQLVQYETARTALAQAISVDEVKDVHNKAEAMRLYGKMAKDTDLEANAAELRLRAERKLGVLLKEEADAGRLAPGRPKKNGTDDVQFSRTLLEGIGIDRHLSSRAQKVGGIAERAFEACVARVRQRIQEGAKVSMDISGATKAERRAARERILGGIQCALPTKKFGVIVADPEWRFEPYSRETGMDRAADNHYPTSATASIAARDVASIAADDCVLFLWATIPMLTDALIVLCDWGFTYKSHYIWEKDKAGTGFWVREMHELFLIGTRGKVIAPAAGTQRGSVITSPRLRHSQKPACFLEMVEEWYPTLPKIELNRRGPARPGWSAWGNEAEAGEPAAEVPPHDPETGEILDEAAPLLAQCFLCKQLRPTPDKEAPYRCEECYAAVAANAADCEL